MPKELSRKGAKTQKAISFAPLRLCAQIFLVFLAATFFPTNAQNKSARFDPDGSFWVIGETPSEFSDFGGINLNTKRLRQIPPSGVQTNEGKNYRFKTVTVKRDNFRFTTVTVRGVYYSFAGKFLKGGNFAATWLGDESPVLSGTLTKFRAGKRVAEAKLKFSYFGGT
jgi:hypothetical protein